MDRIFYCYSNNLRDFLVKNGEKFIAKDIHKKTGKKFWVFIGTDNVNKLLDAFKNNTNRD